MKSLHLVSFMIILSLTSFGQESYRHLVDSVLTIETDVRLDSLVMRHIRVNEAKDGMDGFRVQLFSGSGNAARREANDMRAEFLTQYPDIPAYLIYQVPNFKVRVGDYRTELEAIRTQREVSYLYPQAFVVRDVIKFPKLAIEEEDDDFKESPDDY